MHGVSIEKILWTGFLFTQRYVNERFFRPISLPPLPSTFQFVIIAFISTTQMISLSPLLINFLSRNFFSSSFFLIIFYILLCVYILLYNEYYMLIELRLGACGMVINIYHLVILLSLLNRLLGWFLIGNELSVVYH